MGSNNNNNNRSSLYSHFCFSERMPLTICILKDNTSLSVQYLNDCGINTIRTQREDDVRCAVLSPTSQRSVSRCLRQTSALHRDGKSALICSLTQVEQNSLWANCVYDACRGAGNGLLFSSRWILWCSADFKWHFDIRNSSPVSFAKASVDMQGVMRVRRWAISQTI